MNDLNSNTTAINPCSSSDDLLSNSSLSPLFPPPDRCIRVSGFVRPLNHQLLIDYCKSFGPIYSIIIPFTKSYIIIVYSSSINALSAYTAFIEKKNNKYNQESINTEKINEIIAVEELKKIKENNTNDTKNYAAIINNYPEEEWNNWMNKLTIKNNPSPSLLPSSSSSSSSSLSNQSTDISPDLLFRKTISTPHIYWQPLTALDKERRSKRFDRENRIEESTKRRLEKKREYGESKGKNIQRTSVFNVPGGEALIRRDYYGNRRRDNRFIDRNRDRYRSDDRRSRGGDDRNDGYHRSHDDRRDRRSPFRSRSRSRSHHRRRRSHSRSRSRSHSSRSRSRSRSSSRRSTAATNPNPSWPSAGSSSYPYPPTTTIPHPYPPF